MRGNLACNTIVGGNLDVLGIAGTPQGSVVVMTDADWAGDVKDRRSYSGIAGFCTRGVCVFQGTDHGLLEFW